MTRLSRLYECMRVLISMLRRQPVQPPEMTVADRMALALELGGRHVQDLVVTFGISRSEAKRLLKLRDQFGRSSSPCSLAMLSAIHG
jgi:hypothetical protein